MILFRSQLLNIYMIVNKLFRRFASVDPHLRSINSLGINSRDIKFNITVPELYQIAFLNEPPSDPHTRQSYASQNGAFCAYSGLKMSREGQNSRIVKDEGTEKILNWGRSNIPIDPKSFELIEKFAIDYINHKNRCFVTDGYVGWHPTHRLKVRAFSTRSYHALFMRNMLINPTEKELEEDFSKGVDINIINAGEMAVSKNIPGFTSNMVTATNLSKKKVVILGSQYAGEMKKAIFKLIEYIYPRRGLLPLHASATLNEDGRSTLMCGVSETGKTALALRSNSRKLIADDQLCWGNDRMFNIDGGVYAKVSDLNQDVEPEISKAIKYGTVIENINFYPGSRAINFNDTSLTTNARACFPMNFLPNAQIPGSGPHPSNIILLTCDKKGVLPPIAKLTHEQAYYYFLSGYSVKKVDNDNLNSIPESVFSACFGEQFLPFHPSIYGKLFYQKLKEHNPQIWLMNTGWVHGRYGVGKRIALEDSLKMVNAINSGSLDSAPTYNFKYFNFRVPEYIEGISEQLLHPEKGWNSWVEYNETLSLLAVEFIQNFKKYKGRLGEHSDTILEAGPNLNGSQ